MQHAIVTATATGNQKRRPNIDPPIGGGSSSREGQNIYSLGGLCYTLRWTGRYSNHDNQLGANGFDGAVNQGSRAEVPEAS